jgi:hypothetical protein
LLVQEFQDKVIQVVEQHQVLDNVTIKVRGLELVIHMQVAVAVALV